jgi:hypothetical protein
MHHLESFKPILQRVVIRADGSPTNIIQAKAKGNEMFAPGLLRMWPGDSTRKWNRGPETLQ